MNLCSPSEISALLQRHGFRFSKAMGQNFLIEPSVPVRIAESAGLDKNTGVLEIGPGIGTLTCQLAERAKHVAAVELDKALPPVLEETLADYRNVTVISGDVLKADLPAVLREHPECEKWVVCANLPYNITTPVLTMLLDSGLFERVTVMIQREVAKRICAKAGEEDYGAFTVYANYKAEPRILFDVSPGCFMPQPKVTSSVISLIPRKEPPVPVADEGMFFRTVRAAFAQRRKTLLNCLNAAFPQNKAELIAILRSLGMNEQIRGETLDIPQFARLAEALSGSFTEK